MCNCKGKLPNSVALRQYAVDMATRVAPYAGRIETNGAAMITTAEFVTLSGQIEAFIRGNATDEQIDGKAEHDKNRDAVDQQQERNRRQTLLTQPISALVNPPLRENDIEKLEEINIRSVSDLIQCDAGEAAERTQLGINVLNALRPHSLRLRMSHAEIQRWLANGNADFQAEGE